jgi:hypothetical protein
MLSNVNNDGFVYFKFTDEERKKFPYDFELEKVADMKGEFEEYESALMESYKKKIRTTIKKEIDKIIK